MLIYVLECGWIEVLVDILIEVLLFGFIFDIILLYDNLYMNRVSLVCENGGFVELVDG